jgi:hypothetical protein
MTLIVEFVSLALSQQSDTSWCKPKALGHFDLPTKNEWKLLQDEKGVPYFYNPLTMEMSWTKPTEVVDSNN